MFKFALVGLAFTCLPALADWEYAQTEDKMTSRKVQRAYLESDNSLSLSLPYTGANSARLSVSSTSDGLRVLIQVQKGQMLCGYDDCHVNVRFDDEKPRRWSASEPADHSKDALFLDNEAAFVARAKKAKRILISVPFYQNGNQVLEFSSSKPLEWGPAPKAAKKG